MKLIFSTITILSCLIPSAWATATDESNPASKPNVILMMADDLGYGDLSGYGSTLNRTPVLDRLAAEGIRLTDYHSGSAVCTPSRMALMTGCYPRRVGWPGGVLGHKMNVKGGLATEAYTMAEMFKDAGYRTGMVGKWHLGDHPDRLPLGQGFDESYCIKMSNNQTTKLFRNGKLIIDPFDNRKLTEQFITESIDFIQRNADQPFFLYLPFTAPHFPVQAHPDWKGTSKNKAYGDVVEELDSRIGDMVKALEKLGIDQNTIVIFTSDNGPQGSKKNNTTAHPYRGRKWNSLEGGTRVPFIFNWPKEIKSPKTHTGLTGSIDLMPTLAEACGIELDPSKSPVPIDGTSVWKSLTGASDHPRQHLLLWDGWATPQAIREGNWKLFFDDLELVPESEAGPVLYDLGQDISEQHNIAAQHPDKVASMTNTAVKMLKSIDNHNLPLGGEDASPTPEKARWLK